MERKYKRGQLVKLRPVPEDEQIGYAWDSSDQRNVGKVGRILSVIMDDSNATHPYTVKFHCGGEVTHSEKYLKKAKKWEIRRYNAEKSPT